MTCLHERIFIFRTRRRRRSSISATSRSISATQTTSVLVRTSSFSSKAALPSVSDVQAGEGNARPPGSTLKAWGEMGINFSSDLAEALSVIQNNSTWSLAHISQPVLERRYSLKQHHRNGFKPDRNTKKLLRRYCKNDEVSVFMLAVLLGRAETVHAMLQQHPMDLLACSMQGVPVVGMAERTFPQLHDHLQKELQRRQAQQLAGMTNTRKLPCVFYSNFSIR